MKEILELINQMSPYLLLGFFLAGIMHVFIPDAFYRRFLGGSSFRSVLNAALLGVPLPLCSCGVIPTAMSLKKEGASKGATVSFLIATPQTGVDSIIATYSLLGLPFALIRPVAALLTSLFGGQMVNLLDKNDSAENVRTDVSASASGSDVSLPGKMAKVLRYAYVDMMQDIGKWLVVGLIVAGLITVFVPDSFFALFSDNSLLSMLIVLLFSIPMYLCATGSIPIAAALMMKGLSPGTALVLLMAGPAVNVASMLVVGKVLGRRTLFLYIISIIAGAVLFGLGIDYLLPREWFTQPVMNATGCCTQTMSWFNIVCTILLSVLLLNALILRFKPHKDSTGESCTCSRQTYKIEGLRCNHCKANAEKAIAAIDGVEKVEIDLATGVALVEGKAKEEAIRKALEPLGFRLLPE